MNKLLVIIDAINTSHIKDAVRQATVGRPLPEGVQQIFDRTFIIDIHEHLPFFVSLVNSANSLDLQVAVLSIDNEAVLCRELFPSPLKNS